MSEQLDTVKAVADLCEQIACLKEQVGALREAGSHKVSCNAYADTGTLEDCDCGWRKARSDTPDYLSEVRAKAIEAVADKWESRYMGGQRTTQDLRNEAKALRREGK